MRKGRAVLRGMARLVPAVLAVWLVATVGFGQAAAGARTLHGEGRHASARKGQTLSQVPNPSSDFTASGSAEQVYVTGLTPGERLALLSPAGRSLTTTTADAQGGLIFDNVSPGAGYRVQVYPHGAQSPAVTVHGDDPAPWDASIYDQQISDNGYQYLKTRDGTELSIDVHPPPSPAGLAPGVTLPSIGDYSPPYPTLIEYSGYGYADPAGPINGIAAIANLMGFAVVDVNMRGTGCSGGAYNFFEALQDLDGYDVVETIAHQPWVLGHKVGMFGISYGAISQLFTAQEQPPDLEAIAPMSTIDATATTLYPGGMLNTGFAVAWAQQRQQDAAPALDPSYEQSWAWTRIADGDQTCKANQALHGEAEDLMALIDANSHYKPGFIDTLDPDTFVSKIKVPVYMACQWEDEQTGGHCPDLVQHLTGTSRRWFTFTNGAHVDSLDPLTMDRMFDFLSLYVAHQAPLLNSVLLHAASPLLYSTALGVPGSDAITLPNDPIQQMPSYSAALSAFNALPMVRVLFDNGAGKDPGGKYTAGNPYPGFEASFSDLPVPGTQARYWYLNSGGALADHPAVRTGKDAYTSNPHATPLNDYTGDKVESGGLWGDAAQQTWNWVQEPAGDAVSYLTAPLSQNTTVIGAGAVHVWVRSSTPDVDLLATVSEVDPDGNETFVQNGYLRASERALAKTSVNELAQPSTLLEPVPSFRAADARPMPKNKYVELVIPLYFEGHAYRAQSRIRLTLSAPNGTQPVWSFAHPQPAGGSSRMSVEFSAKTPSSLILPVVPGVSVPTPLPACHSLRNEPCRKYVPTGNAS